MLEITKYQCEFCGKMFEDEWVCIDHEDEHKLEEAKGHVEMWDENGEKCALTDTTEAFYLHIIDEIGRQFIEERFKKEGYCTPYYDTGAEIGYFYYDQGDGDWHKVIDLVEKVNKVLSILGKPGISFSNK